MELTLTDEQLRELSHDQMDRLQPWWAKKHEGEPLLTTMDKFGQCVTKDRSD